MHTWYLSGIDPQPFQALFNASDADLATQGIERRRADDSGGHPCRVSLRDAPCGAELLLLPYAHLATHSPYRASGPVFVQRGATRCVLPAGVVPPYVQRRLISVRAYDRNDLMVSGQVCQGSEVAGHLDRVLADAAVAFVQLHNAGPGCFSCQVDRVDRPLS